MKKYFVVPLSVIMVCLLAVLQASAAVTDPATVGGLGSEVDLAPGFSQADLPKVQQLMRQEYNRGVRTRSLKHKGTAYFNYGQSTGELVHAWVGSERMTGNGQVLPAAACMNQDFIGGYSDTLATMGMSENWCCIMVTPESFKKGEAYTLRDAFANAWGNVGGTNSFWGLPTGNQYWIGDTCYQTFEYGYAVSENAQFIFTEFHFYADGETAPAVPNDAAYDHYTDVAVTEAAPPLIDPEPSDVPGDLDGDTLITVSDVVQLRQLIISGSPTKAQLTCGDLDEDGKLTVGDVVTLRQWIVSGIPMQPA